MRSHDNDSQRGVREATPALPDCKASGLEDQLAFTTRAVRRIVARHHWTQWSREEREVYVRKALLDTARQVREITQGVAPVAGWTVPPAAIRAEVDELLDTLANWTVTGALEDWMAAYRANHTLRAAVREAGYAARSGRARRSRQS